MKESEKDTERYLVEQIEQIGGLCRKFVSPGVRGVPDRICIMPRGKVIWVETKSEGDHTSPAQEREHTRLKERWHTVYIIDTKEKVDLMIRKEKL